MEGVSLAIFVVVGEKLRWESYNEESVVAKRVAIPSISKEVANGVSEVLWVRKVDRTSYIP